MTKKLLNILFLGLILLVLLAGLLRTVFFPKEINAYENRYAERIAPFTVEGYLDGTFQDSVDAALSDQVHLSQYYKQRFNLASSRCLKTMVTPFLEQYPDRYIDAWGMRLIGRSYLAYYPRVLANMTDALDAKIENLNRCFTAFPDVDFYVYYVEKDTDINFETNEKVLAYEYLRDGLALPEDRMARFQIDSFDDFSARFYQTDHHWNYYGSYQGYTEVIDLLGVSDPPLVPLGEAVLSDSFSGSKVSSSGAYGFSESFSAYRFAFPSMDVQINGSPAEDYGNQDAFLSGQGGQVSYGAFYGGDDGEVILSTGQTDRENLLIVGESYDNAILKLVAAHFNNTCSIDLRYYSAYMGQEFHLADYLEEHDIAKVLLIGNIDYFTSSDFLLEV